MKNDSEESLAPGWTRPMLSQLVEGAQSGFASGEKAVVNGLQHLRMNNIGEEGTLVLDLLRTVPLDLAKAKHKLELNDVLVCTTNSGKLVGKCALFDQPGDFAYSNHITRLRPKEGVVDANFLRWSLWFAWKAGTYEELCQHWVNQSTLPKDLLMAVEIPLPPLAEQRRIVAKLEVVLARVNAARQRLAKAPALLKRFRQSVLAALLCGEESSLGDVLVDLKYGTSKKCEQAKHGVPVLRIPNVSQGIIDQNDLKYAELDPKECKATELCPGDLLMIRSNGSVSLLGRTALVTEREKGFSYAGYLMRLRLDLKKVDPKYAYLALSGHSCRDQIEMPARSTSCVNNINSDEVRKLRLPIPSISEQREIVRRAEALFALADKIEARVTAARARADKLIQSTLAKAFRGELVPTEYALRQATSASAQTIEEGLAALYALALLHTWQASPDRRAFELGMILMQKDGVRKRIVQRKPVASSANGQISTLSAQVGRMDEFIGELLGATTIKITNRQTRQVIALGTNAPARADLLKDQIGVNVFKSAAEAVEAVGILNELGQSFDLYATADDYDTVEIAIS